MKFKEEALRLIVIGSCVLTIVAISMALLA
jgi:hypothetical protein